MGKMVFIKLLDSSFPYHFNKDDLMNIELTPFPSKRMERLLIKWIWKYLVPHIGLDQLGGLPGCSIVHYIIRMFDFILCKVLGHLPRRQLPR